MITAILVFDQTGHEILIPTHLSQHCSFFRLLSLQGQLICQNFLSMVYSVHVTFLRPDCRAAGFLQISSKSIGPQLLGKEGGWESG